MRRMTKFHHEKVAPKWCCLQSLSGIALWDRIFCKFLSSFDLDLGRN